MRTIPPHPWIRFRHALIALALLAWLIAAVTLLGFKGNPDVPVAPITGFSGFVFVWANGMYWWIMLRYPFIEVGEGNFASHDEWKGKDNRGFFVCYFLLAAFASIACIKMAING